MIFFVSYPLLWNVSAFSSARIKSIFVRRWEKEARQVYCTRPRNYFHTQLKNVSSFRKFVQSSFRTAAMWRKVSWADNPINSLTLHEWLKMKWHMEKTGISGHYDDSYFLLSYCKLVWHSLKSFILDAVEAVHNHQHTRHSSHESTRKLGAV